MRDARARSFWLVAILILLLAFGLRLLAMDRQDLWGDEAISVYLSSGSLARAVAGSTGAHPPLYRVLLFVWIRLVGASVWGVRSLSALLGTLIVPVVYVLGRRSYGRRAARWAALLAASSPMLVYYSQETRMYVLVTLLASLSIAWVLRSLREGVGASIIYGAVTLAAVYSHYYAFLVIVAENLVVFAWLVRRRRWRSLGRWLGTQAAIAAAYVPWIAYKRGFLGEKANTRFEEWNVPTALSILGQTLRSFSTGLSIPPAAAWSLTALFLAAALVGVAMLWRQRKVEGWMIGAWLVIPLGLAWLINPFMSLFYPRYLLLIAPAYYLLVSSGLAALRRLWRPAGALAAACLVAGSGVGLWGYFTDEAYVRGRYGQMMAYIEAHSEPGDGLLLANPLQRPIFEYYQPEGLEAYYLPHQGYPLEDARTTAELEAIAARHPRLWLVRFGNPAEYDPTGYLLRWLSSHGSKAYFDGWVDADLSLFAMLPGGDADAIQHPLRVDLGGQMRLLGYALSADAARPGEVLFLTLYWQALEPIDERYTVFTHLLDSENQIQAQVDSEPQGGGLPTDHWVVGEVVQDNYALQVADTAVPGEHVVEVGLYLVATGDRLAVYDPASGEWLGDRILLGPIDVVAP